MHDLTNPTVDALGNKRWCNSDSELHRTDGPAVEWANGDRSWYLNGKRHRTDGPAIEYADGDAEWYFDNIEYPFEDYVKVAKWSDEQVVMYKLVNG